MILFLTQPELHNLDCRTCWLYAINDETQKPIPKRGSTGEFQKRGIGVAPPCGKCPKQSPEKAAQYELSDRNWQAYQHYLQCRAMGFNGMTAQEKRDPIIRSNFAIIDDVLRALEDKQRTQAMMMAVQSELKVAAKGRKKP